MKHYFKNNFFAVVTALGMMTATVACSAEGEWLDEPASDDEEQSVRMTLHGGVMSFDVGQTRGDDAWEWQDGTVIFIQFHANDTEIVHGHATYSMTDDEWNVSYTGQLADAGSCEVYFFDGASVSDKHQVTLNETNAVYAATNGSYSTEGNSLAVTAVLVPLTGRIRFKGDSGVGITVTGLSVYTGYDADENKLTMASGAVNLFVGDDGYTPYAYSVFADAGNPMLRIVNSVDGGIAFQQTFGSNVLRIGESGYMTIPTEDKNKGWNVVVTYIPFTVSGITFTMRLVEGGTFTMGATAEMTNPQSNEKPTHQVTLSNYYMGETEVTQALWTAVMGSNPSNWKGDDLPVEKVSWNDCQTFITKLNALTGQTFRLPTEAEWEYAARGGSKSSGTQYSGSSNLDEVAWYKGNSGSKTHAVKTKKANELGLYDMSGNVYEWCQDWYGNYSSSAQTNPTGPSSGSVRQFRGGSWNYDAGCCRSSHRNGYYPDYTKYYLGFRLALSE